MENLLFLGVPILKHIRVARSCCSNGFRELDNISNMQLMRPNSLELPPNYILIRRINMVKCEGPVKCNTDLIENGW